MSSNRKISDLLFGVQIIGAVLFCGSYIHRSLTDITGSSVAQFGLVAAFLVFQFWLGIGAHRAAPSRLTWQTLATYAVWLILVLVLMGTAWRNPTYRWNDLDTTTLLTAVVLTIAVLGITYAQGLTVKDPMSKAFFAIAYKSVPQMLLAWKFLEEGASGTPGMAIIVGHATILIRLGQIYFMVRENGLDRNRIWLAISEAANELSWVVVTVAWFVVI